MKDKKKNLKMLADEIFKHDRMYYIDASPSISDREYDKLKETYKALTDKYGFDIDKSPISQVGDSLGQTGGTRVSHNVPMLSLDNTYDSDELVKWADTKTGLLVEKGLPLVYMSAEPKLDGVSMSILYDSDGNFTRLATRGDGLVGEDISHLAHYIKGIPMQVDKEIEEVRGEGIIFKDDFEKINAKLHEEKGRLYMNPRNLTGGSLSLKNMKKFVDRKVRFIAFDVFTREPIEPSRKATKLHMSGFSSAEPFDVGNSAKSKEENFEDMIEKFEAMQNDLPYEIDGIVFKFTQSKAREILGVGTKAPKWAVAFKFKENAVATKLKAVTWHVGTKGKVTPVASLEPVKIKGSMVSKATLHNCDEIVRLGVRVNDMVSVIKAAAIIPKITGVNKKMDDGIDIAIPYACPSCGEVLVKSGPSLNCYNINCPAKNMRVLIKFASRDAMDISGLGEGVLAQLEDALLISDIPSIYDLTNKREAIMDLDGWGVKSTDNLIDSINRARVSNTPSKLLYSLNIEGCGKNVSKLVWGLIKSRGKNTIDELLMISVDDLLQLEGIGQKTAEDMVRSIKANSQLIIKMNALVTVDETIVEVDEVVSKFSGQNVCVTGKFDSIIRQDIADYVVASGGKYMTSVNSKTTILVAGDKAGSKLSKAKELNIEILNENDVISIMY